MPHPSPREIPIVRKPYDPKDDPARRNADNYFAVWEKRKVQVRDQAAAESAASDAKTARLKALRLEKEAADQAAAGSQTEAPKPGAKRRP